MLRDVTFEEERAKEIFDMLCRGLVTPITAYDVIEDILS